MRTCRAWLFLPLLLGMGCGSPQTSPSAASPSPSAPVPVIMIDDGAGIGSAAANPTPQATPGKDHSSAGVGGTIAERIDIPNFTYLRLTTNAGDVWAAVPTSEAKVGAQVTIANPMIQREFKSPVLKRTFDVLVFGTSADVFAASSSTPAAPTATPDAGLQVAKLPGSITSVADVYRDKKSLEGQQITVRGKVVKLTAAVLDHTWIHVRDGSGSDAAKDNDLVVTTKDPVKLGQEVTASGVLHGDKNLGSGYAFSVLVEDAKISP